VYKLVKQSGYYTLINLSSPKHAQILFTIFSLYQACNIQFLNDFIKKHYSHMPEYGIGLFPKTANLTQLINLLHGLTDILKAHREAKKTTNPIKESKDTQPEKETEKVSVMGCYLENTAKTLQANEKELGEDFVPFKLTPDGKNNRVIPDAVTYDLDLRPDYVCELQKGDTIKYFNRIYKVVVQQRGSGRFSTVACHLESTKDNHHNKLLLDACCYSPNLLKETGLYADIKRVNPGDNIHIDNCRSPVWFINTYSLTDLVNKCIEQIRIKNAKEADNRMTTKTEEALKKDKQHYMQERVKQGVGEPVYATPATEHKTVASAEQLLTGLPYYTDQPLPPTNIVLDYFGTIDPRTMKCANPHGAERGRSPEIKPGRYL
jgi:hypothetical protein